MYSSLTETLKIALKYKKSRSLSRSWTPTQQTGPFQRCKDIEKAEGGCAVMVLMNILFFKINIVRLY